MENHVQDRLDPNTAEWYELAQLPGIGEALAERIIHVRATLPPESGLAFGGIEDLRKVRGIGPKSLRKLESYLRFGRRESIPLTVERPVDTVNSALSPLESGG